VSSRPSELIVLDTSVIIAIILREPHFLQFRECLESARKIYIGYPTIFEIDVVLKRRDLQRETWVATWQQLLLESYVEKSPFDQNLYRRALEGYARFSQGRHGLNYGDCFSYALAKHLDLPLLFKGNDFTQTDVKIHSASVITA
jgi:ribonuclease VapC